MHGSVCLTAWYAVHDDMGGHCVHSIIICPILVDSWTVYYLPYQTPKHFSLEVHFYGMVQEHQFHQGRYVHEAVRTNHPHYKKNFFECLVGTQQFSKQLI